MLNYIFWILIGTSVALAVASYLMELIESKVHSNPGTNNKARFWTTLGALLTLIFAFMVFLYQNVIL